MSCPILQDSVVSHAGMTAHSPFGPFLRSMGYTEPRERGSEDVAPPPEKIWILHQSIGDDRHRLLLFPAVCACDRRCTYDLYGLRLLPVTPREGGSYENCRGEKPKVPRWPFADDLQNRKRTSVAVAGRSCCMGGKAVLFPAVQKGQAPPIELVGEVVISRFFGTYSGCRIE